MTAIYRNPLRFDFAYFIGVSDDFAYISLGIKKRAGDGNRTHYAGSINNIYICDFRKIIGAVWCNLADAIGVNTVKTVLIADFFSSIFLQMFLRYG